MENVKEIVPTDANIGILKSKIDLNKRKSARLSLHNTHNCDRELTNRNKTY